MIRSLKPLHSPDRRFTLRIIIKKKKNCGEKDASDGVDSKLIHVCSRLAFANLLSETLNMKQFPPGLAFLRPPIPATRGRHAQLEDGSIVTSEKGLTSSCLCDIPALMLPVR